MVAHGERSAAATAPCRVHPRTWRGEIREPDRAGQLRSDRTNCRKDGQPSRVQAAKNQASWYCLSWRGLQSGASTPDDFEVEHPGDYATLNSYQPCRRHHSLEVEAFCACKLPLTEAQSRLKPGVGTFGNVRARGCAGRCPSLARRTVLLGWIFGAGGATRGDIDAQNGADRSKTHVPGDARRRATIFILRISPLCPKIDQ